MDKLNIPSAPGGAEEENMDMDSPPELPDAGGSGSGAGIIFPAFMIYGIEGLPKPTPQFTGAIGIQPRHDTSPLTPEPLADRESKYYDQLWGVAGTLTNMDLMTVDPYDQGASREGGRLFDWLDETPLYEERAQRSVSEPLFKVVPQIVRVPDSTPGEYNPVVVGRAAASTAPAAAGGFEATSQAPVYSVAKKFEDLHLEAGSGTGGGSQTTNPGAAATSIAGFLTTTPGSSTFQLFQGPSTVLRFPSIQFTSGSGVAAAGPFVPMGLPPSPLPQKAKAKGIQKSRRKAALVPTTEQEQPEFPEYKAKV